MPSVPYKYGPYPAALVADMPITAFLLAVEEIPDKDAVASSFRVNDVDLPPDVLYTFAFQYITLSLIAG
jgi:hypothetical protein